MTVSLPDGHLVINLVCFIYWLRLWSSIYFTCQSSWRICIAWSGHVQSEVHDHRPQRRWRLLLKPWSFAVLLKIYSISMKRNTLSIMPVRWVPIWVRASSFLSYVWQLEIKIELNCRLCRVWPWMPDSGCSSSNDPWNQSRWTLMAWIRLKRVAGVDTKYKKGIGVVIRSIKLWYYIASCLHTYLFRPLVFLPFPVLSLTIFPQ